ncbi:ABC transporter permease [Kitasatospora sp. NPDC089509]|uniref:ABC transporter permease n=1 Tax=Kitasatospora sp. NPDC089509 TaxID=3364079 RepID=UPI0037FCD483
MLVLMPLLSRPVVAAVGPVYRRLFGISGRLARQNAARNPRRTAATASALTVGVMLISLLTVIATSVNTMLANRVTKDLKADYRISMMQQAQPISPAVLPAIRQVSGVAIASPLDSQLMEQSGSDGSGGRPMPIYGVDDKVIDELINPSMVSGSMAALQQGQLLIGKSTAALGELSTGSTVVMKYPDGTKALLSIGGVYDSTVLDGAALLSHSVLGNHEAEPHYTQILVKGSHGASGQLQQALKDASGANPLIRVQSHADLQKEFSSMITLALNILYALLGVSVLVAVLGVVNTLAMSVFERKREIGMLRAIGLDRGGIRRMVRLESVLISLFGAGIGLLLGCFIAWAINGTLKSSLAGLTTVLPYGQLALFLGLAGLVGLVAAIWPARRAAGLGILSSIKTV